MTTAEAAKVEAELQRLLTFVERVNGDRETKLENLVRYALDEAKVEVKHAAEPPIDPMDVHPDLGTASLESTATCGRCDHLHRFHGKTGVCLLAGCSCPDYQATATAR